MDVIGAMKARRSVRSYLPRKVEQEKLNAVLEAVRLTPSRHNDQNIRVIVVRDSALKQQIRQQAETQPMVEEADVLLVFCATDRTDFVMPCGQYGYVVDMSLATGFALLEAAEQGLDTCIICAFREDAVKDLLHVPASSVPPPHAVVNMQRHSTEEKIRSNFFFITSLLLFHILQSPVFTGNCHFCCPL